MDLKTLKKYKKGEQVDCGLLFPTVIENEEIRWTVADILHELGVIKVTFTLDFLGVSMGAVRAVGGSKGVTWETVQ